MGESKLAKHPGIVMDLGGRVAIQPRHHLSIEQLSNNVQHRRHLLLITTLVLLMSRRAQPSAGAEPRGNDDTWNVRAYGAVGNGQANDTRGGALLGVEFGFLELPCRGMGGDGKPSRTFNVLQLL